MKLAKNTTNCQPKPAAGLVRVNLKSHTSNTSTHTSDSDPYIPFTIQIRRSTYFAIKQAEYWTPGFGEIRGHVDVALKKYMAQMPGSDKPLPEKERAKNKKLQG